MRGSGRYRSGCRLPVLVGEYGCQFIHSAVRQIFGENGLTRASSDRDLSALGRWRKLVLVMSYDAVAMFAALWAGFAIRLDTLYWPIDAQVLFIATLAVIGGLLGLHALGVYRIVIRYLDHRTVVKLLAGAGLAAIVWFSLAYLSGVRFLPRSVGLIYWAI